LVVQQIYGEWDARDVNMAMYRFLNMALYRFHIQQLSACFEGCEFHHVPRASNEAANSLARVGSNRQAIPHGVSLEHLCKTSTSLSPESDSIIRVADLGAVGLKDPGAAGSWSKQSPADTKAPV
jgi:hypothetical protein